MAVRREQNFCVILSYKHDSMLLKLQTDCVNTASEHCNKSLFILFVNLNKLWQTYKYRQKFTIMFVTEPTASKFKYLFIIHKLYDCELFVSVILP